MMDVDHAKVRAAFRLAGDKLEAERLQRIEQRNAAHVAAGGRMCSSLGCTRPSSFRVSSGAYVCVVCAPPQPHPGCSKPLLCYKPCCQAQLPALRLDAQRRQQRHVEQSTWLVRVRDEIERLARGRDVFTLAELAEFGRGEKVRAVLDAAVAHEFIEKHPTRDEWRGTGREPVRDAVPPPPVIVVDYIERENRYQ